MSEDTYMDSLRSETGAAAPPSRSNDIHADHDSEGRENFHGPDAFKRGVEALVEERRRKAEQAPTPEPERRLPPKAEPHVDEAPVVKRHLRGDGPVDLRTAARELRNERSLDEDHEYRATVETVDALVENGSDAELAKKTLDDARILAEQKRARQLAGLDDVDAGDQPRDSDGRYASQEPEVSEATLRERAEIARQQSAVEQRAQAVDLEREQVSKVAAVREAEQALAQVEQIARHEFADLRSPSDLNRLPPERLARLQQLDQVHRQISDLGNAAAIQAQHIERHGFEQYGKSQDSQFDREFAKAVPDPAERAAIKAAAPDFVKQQLGLDDDAIQRGWNYDKTFRSVAAQKLIMTGTRAMLVEQRKAQARKTAEREQWDRESKFPVHRPSDSYPRVGAAEAGRQLPRGFENMSVRNQLKSAAQAIAKARGNGKSSGGSSIV